LCIGKRRCEGAINKGLGSRKKKEKLKKDDQKGGTKKEEDKEVPLVENKLSKPKNN